MKYLHYISVQVFFTDKKEVCHETNLPSPGNENPTFSLEKSDSIPVFFSPAGGRGEGAGSSI
jgi:hypothetical protein